MTFKIRVSMPRVAEFYDNNVGLQIMIHMEDFDDYPYELPQCWIEGEAPRDADVEHKNPIIADASYSSSKFQERGKNLMFEPIPMEMLYTPAYKPQVLVTVNDLAAVCPA